MKRLAVLFAMACMFIPSLDARHSSNYCYSCARDDHGRIKRSNAARHKFENQSPCPSTGRRYGACPGYVIDHTKALACGGADDPSNMQWQTREAAKEKDKWETKGCK